VVKVSLGSEWSKVQRRYKNVKVQSIIDKGIALWGADLMVAEAKKEIDKLVYDAPLPESATNQPDYEDRSRTRRTRNAIKRDRMRGGMPPGAVGFEAYVDKKDYPAYYYASILNFGGKPGGRMHNYKARPFWTNAATIVKSLFKRKGITVMTEIKGALEKG